MEQVEKRDPFEVENHLSYFPRTGDPQSQMRAALMYEAFTPREKHRQNYFDVLSRDFFESSH